LDRRAFTVALVSSFLASCGKAPKGMRQSPFSRVKLIEGLETLRLAFEAKAHHVTESLLPAVEEHELRKRCAWFPAPLPVEITALYSWHEGQPLGPWDTKYPFWFRDYGFSSLATAEHSYERIMDSYGADPPHRELLRGAFPFAEFNGGWLVLPTAPGGFGGLERPVISVHQGINVFFYSINAMIDTSIDWVSHPSWNDEGLYPASLELEIWRKHNPGIFAGGA
jgi:hypothetical protein